MQKHNHMYERVAAAARDARGFTLVEILVGLVLGLIGIVVMYQMFAIFEGQKRTTISGSDAQIAGLLGLNAIELHARNAGAGLTWSKPVDETNYQTFVLCTTVNLPGSPGQVLMPVYIENNAVNGSDRITIAYSNARAAAAPAVLSTTVTSNTAALPLKNTVTTLDATFAPVATGATNFALIGQPTEVPVPIPAAGAISPLKPCARLQISAVTSTGTTTAELTHSTPPNFPAAGTCPAGYTIEATCGSTIVPAAVIVPMGEFVWLRYFVNANNQLISENRHTGATEVIAEDVIAMHAQYGVTPRNCTQANPVAGGDAINCQGQIRWIDATNQAAGFGDFSAPQNDIGAVARIKALRIAIATRSALRERDNVTVTLGGTTCNRPGDVIGTSSLCLWNDNQVAGNNDQNAPRADLSGIADWRTYRYRVYETIVPLRNVLWGNI